MKPLTIGIAGIAKNTGKTTTARALLEYFQNREISLGVTSIGYDGERTDNITGLPKPRVFLKKGNLVAVSEKCLSVSTARVKVMNRMDIPTPLGSIVSGRVVEEGLLVLAGPNQSRYLRTIRDWMYRHGAEIVLVDGALNRVAPMVETDGFILCTGASYDTDMDRLALETRGIEVLCNLPGTVEIPPAVAAGGKSVLWDQNGRILAELPAFLWEPGPLAILNGLPARAGGFYLPGVISSGCLEAIRRMTIPAGFKFVFENPVKLLLGGSVVTARLFVEDVLERGGKVFYRRSLPLIAVTVNPFYPGYKNETCRYLPAFVDGEVLLSKIRESVDVPVFNVVKQGPEELGGLLLVLGRQAAC
ncbi:hypothetical protein clustered with lysine fermentation genes [Desulfocucumis palustris]|uniref:Uncharacterized protein n=1 Tax=Desulfocucumis palustris TaxID=1898651 RepID=A0A2L2XF51_9FIRM|nr:hypothetical protein [Desulfocucumis palustris]GBF34780.1 hypothetical protein clustered with lysine fermentation genes [Desulfocucumis palustris]